MNQVERIFIFFFFQVQKNGGQLDVWVVQIVVVANWVKCLNMSKNLLVDIWMLKMHIVETFLPSTTTWGGFKFELFISKFSKSRPVFEFMTLFFFL